MFTGEYFRLTSVPWCYCNILLVSSVLLLKAAYLITHLMNWKSVLPKLIALHNCCLSSVSICFIWKFWVSSLFLSFSKADWDSAFPEVICKKKKCKKAKWLSEEALQIAVKRREAKGKGEKERYTHLNEEFQSLAGRGKKGFLSHQCKETEENNRMGETRGLFKKIRDTKGTLHAKMGTIKDRNSRNLTEAEDIEKRLQEYTEELYKKYLHDQIITMVCSLT